MKEQNLSNIDRLTELLADERIGTITPEERAELESLLEQSQADAGSGAPETEQKLDEAIGQVLVALDRAELHASTNSNEEQSEIPSDLKTRVATRGRAFTSQNKGNMRIDPQTQAPEVASRSHSGSARPAWIAAAACLAIGATVSFGLWRTLTTSRETVTQLRAEAQQQAQENRKLVALAQSESDRLGEQLNQAQRRNTELVTQLAEATSRADLAETRIAELTTPRSPDELDADRRQLLDINGTVRIAWQPFDVPGLPDTEQPGVTGDVVWNDDLEEGYLRFVGLAVNDPSTEQYQVWVIDERGMEQKVSGGLFDATESGELIIPIEPGIDVGNVQVFAVTIEEPGGIWVPDLRRRIVVAPRDE